MNVARYSPSASAVHSIRRSVKSPSGWVTEAITALLLISSKLASPTVARIVTAWPGSTRSAGSSAVI